MNKELSDLCFDYIVEGTGLFESILVCALSKAGKRVLQVEAADYYGAQSEGTVWNHNHLQQIGQFSITNEIQGKLKFDLGVKMLYADCPLSRLMIRTRLAAHLDFKAVDCIQYYCTNKGQFVDFPLTKEQIFLSKDLSLIEKRNTMQFLKRLAQSPDTLLNASELHNLPATLQEGIGMCIAHKEELDQFVDSCGKFSPTPFLYCMFGSVEVVQSFVRLAAVNGTIQMLNAKPMQWFKEQEDNFFTLIQCEGANEAPEQEQTSTTTQKNHQISLQSLFTPPPNSPLQKDLFTRTKTIISKSPLHHQEGFTWRKIAFLSAPILHSNHHHQQPAKAIKAYKKLPNHHTLHIFQCDHTSMLCPEGTFFCAFESEVPFDAEYDQIIQPKSIILSQLSFQVPKAYSFTCNTANNLNTPNTPNQQQPTLFTIKNNPNFSQYFAQAQAAFHTLEPDLEFFPNAPNGHSDTEQ